MDFLKGISQTLQEALQSNSPDTFAKANFALAQMKSRIRERFQEVTAGDLTGIIAKLESNEPLTPEEKNFVRTWMVGDADSYMRLENNFKDWTGELTRLAEVLKAYEAKDETVPNLLNAHALLWDAMRVAADISHYLEEKDRIERFEKAIQTLNPADAELLARLLRAKMEESDM